MGFPQAVVDLSSGNVVAVTPANSGSDFTLCRGLWVGTGGDVKVLSEQGQAVVFANVPDGFLLPVRCTRVYATGTTASDIVAMI